MAVFPFCLLLKGHQPVSLSCRATSLSVCLAGWSVGRFVDWSVGWSVGCLDGWTVGRSVIWLVGWSVGWSIGSLIVQSAGSWLVGWLVSELLIS